MVVGTARIEDEPFDKGAKGKLADIPGRQPWVGMSISMTNLPNSILTASSTSAQHPYPMHDGQPTLVPEKRYGTRRHLARSTRTSESFWFLQRGSKISSDPIDKSQLYIHHLHLQLSAGFAGIGDASQMPFYGWSRNFLSHFKFAGKLRRCCMQVNGPFLRPPTVRNVTTRPTSSYAPLEVVHIEWSSISGDMLKARCRCRKHASWD
jgi:hypothetical protein